MTRNFFAQVFLRAAGSMLEERPRRSTMNPPATDGNSSPRVLSIGLPTGSLHGAGLGFFAKPGSQFSGASRSYKPSIDDPELRVRLLRAQEISRYVEHGF